MNGQRIGYVRVSSVDQNTVRQLDGVQVDRTFTDRQSGKDTDRPQLHALLAHVREGDTVLVHSMDRFARSLMDLHRLVDDLTRRGVQVEFVHEQLVFTGQDSPMAKLQLSLMGAFSEFERSMIKQRQAEGIAKAKERGVYKGRAHSLTPEQVVQLREQAQAGTPKAELARQFGVSRQTVYTYLAQVTA